MHILIGAIIIVVGALLVIKAELVYNVFGPIAFFEKYLGSEGGSRLGYKLFGILVVFIGMLVLTNMFGGFMNWILSPLIKQTSPEF